LQLAKVAPLIVLSHSQYLVEQHNAAEGGNSYFLMSM
jgi:hypothetical protein